MSLRAFRQDAYGISVSTRPHYANITREDKTHYRQLFTNLAAGRYVH